MQHNRKCWRFGSDCCSWRSCGSIWPWSGWSNILHWTGLGKLWKPPFGTFGGTGAAARGLACGCCECAAATLPRWASKVILPPAGGDFDTAFVTPISECWRSRSARSSTRAMRALLLGLEAAPGSGGGGDATFRVWNDGAPTSSPSSISKFSGCACLKLRSRSYHCAFFSSGKVLERKIWE